MGAAGAVAAGVEKEDKCELINGMWSLAFNGQTARCNDRNQIEAEMFGLYKSQIDADFGLYKSQRDGFDITNTRVSELEKEVAVLRATRPYQDAPLFSIEATKKIYDRRIRPLNKDVTMWDVYVALNAQYHDNINLYEKWFPNATNNEIEDKIVEATISNWFEDEDASSDKVWEYFRVI